MPRPVFLIGFMASGKSTVGRAVAGALGRRFVDLDDAIEAAAGATVAELFAREGEAGFRARERAALDAALAGPAAVVATGGGAAVDPDDLGRMRRRGAVIALDVSLDTARARAGADRGRARPLLARADGEIAALHAARRPAYRRGHAAIDTEGRTIAEVAAAVVEAVGHAERLADDEVADASVVAVGERSYPVVVAAGALDDVGARVAAALPGVRRVALVSDANVDPLHGARVAAALAAAGLAVSRDVVPAGEASKSGAGYLALADELIAAGLDRGSAIVALGGGVVGDLAGFVAATLFRGVPIVHLPTTLLAMVDSAIGGKTGIDTAAGKNLLGAFWQAALVVVDPAVLATLPARERRAAFGELVKYGLLDGERLYAEVEGAAPGLTGEAPPSLAALAALAPLIGRAVAIKAAIVGCDERERRGERALLNLGHTVGHAIEAAAGYGVVHHGEAVALGLIAAARVSAALGLAPPELERRIAGTVRAAGLDADLDRWLRPDVVARVAVDKKRRGGEVGFVTVAAPGACAVTPLPLDRLAQILAARPSP